MTVSLIGWFGSLVYPILLIIFMMRPNVVAALKPAKPVNEKRFIQCAVGRSAGRNDCGIHRDMSSLSIAGHDDRLGSSAALRAWNVHDSTWPAGSCRGSFPGPAAGAAFMVRGYILIDSRLSIERPGWESRLDLSRLNSATVDPDALRGSLRLFGNGGFFSFTGWFRNKKLGIYRAYVTDTKRAVVLRFADKTVVITPDDPQKFVAEINANKP